MAGRSKPRIKRINATTVQKNCRIVAIKDLSPEDLQELKDQEIVEGAGSVDSQLDPEQLVGAIMEVREELYQIDREAKRTRRGISVGRLETMKLRVTVLKQQADLLLKCLTKTLPDKKHVDQTISILDKFDNLDSIPDEILAAAMAGKLSPEDEEKLALLLSTTEGGEH